MQNNPSKKSIILTIALVGCVLLLGLLSFYYCEQTIRVAFARDQIQVFADMREKAVAGDELQALSCLTYVVNYYPSGTKHVPGTPLDNTVEAVRKIAIEDIVAILRQKAKKDLGPDYIMWLGGKTASKSP